MPTAEVEQDYAFYCDESGISNDRFVVVGGLCLAKGQIPKVLQNMQAFRRDHNMTRELKWTKITNGKVNQYKHLVEYFFAMNNVNHCQFHAIIFDSHKWKHKKYNDGDEDKGLSKLYYQILHRKFSGICGAHGSLYVRLDKRNSSTSLHDLRAMLNNAAARDHGLTNRPFKVVESTDSKECDILQLNDVILGAVCAVRNGKHILATTRDAKREIGKLVLDKSGLGTFDCNSPKANYRFSIWNMIPKE